MLSLMNMLVNGFGTVIFGQIIVLTPPSFSTPSNNCTGSFTVGWGAVADATSFLLQRRLNGGAWETIYSGPSLSFAQSGLGVGAYEYQIIAEKGSKQSAPVATGAVTVLAQGNVGAPFRQGNQLIQQVRSGCSLSNNVVGTYGCTDPTANNYNPSATLNEGCTYDPPCVVTSGTVVYSSVVTGDANHPTVRLHATPSVQGGVPGQYVASPQTWTKTKTGIYSEFETIVVGIYEIDYWVRSGTIDLTIDGYTIGGCA